MIKITVTSNTIVSQNRCDKMRFILCSKISKGETYFFVLSVHGKKEVKYLPVGINTDTKFYTDIGTIILDIQKKGLHIYPENYPSKLFLDVGSKIIMEFTTSTFETQTQNILDLFVF